ncbi:MAG: hypothetical protein KBB56_07010 [Acidobacteria bacterium]|jgi:hypothetical protein|nr:hypothetical protein [Acidobacteriota bacterium]HNU01927.1 hypothetical protein [Acidobacteriota bacterium]HPB29243.1 hypothetical protein [Acidobacteriota bacterium]
MKKYDQDTETIILKGASGYQFDIESSFLEAEQANGLGSSALVFLNTAIRCLLVNYEGPSLELLNKAREWLLTAIEQCEKPNHYFPYATEAGRYSALSILSWLLENKHDIESLSNSVHNRDLYLTTITQWDKVGISMILPDYFDAGFYSRAIEIFEKTHGFHLPKQIDRIKTEGPLIYIMCRHQLEIDDRSEELTAGVQAFLNRNMNQWLVNGHFDVAARWMKIVYWKQGNAGMSSRDALMKCLSHI